MVPDGYPLGRNMGRLEPPRRLLDRPVAQSSAGAATPLTPTVFHETWWLDAVAPGQWQEVTTASGGRIIGRMPFLIEKRLGYTTIGMPMLTHFLGPAVEGGEGPKTSHVLKRISITRALVDALPPADGLWVKFHRGITDTLAFQRAGYRNEVQFTCEIAPAPEAELWAGLRDTTRRVIRSAAKRHEVIMLDDPERFVAFYQDNLAARGLTNTYAPETCLRLLQAIRQHNAGQVLAAVDASGALQAAILTVWDDQLAYYLMSTRRPDADSGAASLLIWTAICHAAARGLTYDLDGISKVGDIQFLTRFGGTVHPRYFVNCSSFRFRLASRGSDRLRGWLSRRRSTPDSGTYGWRVS